MNTSVLPYLVQNFENMGSYVNSAMKLRLVTIFQSNNLMGLL